jgi:hypothetical protein
MFPIFSLEWTGRLWQRQVSNSASSRPPKAPRPSITSLRRTGRAPARLAWCAAHIISSIPQFLPQPKLNCFPALDLEGDEWNSIPIGERAPLAIQWLETVESKLGVTPFVYLSPSFAQEVLNNQPALGRFPLWLAHYTSAAAPTVPKPWEAWTFWQYTNAGTTPGVTTPVDLDRFTGSPDDLKALTVHPQPSP